MKVIAYTRMLPGGTPGGIEHFLKGLAKAKAYGLDGAYFDGPARGGWEDTLTLVRESRKLFRDGILVMHSYPGRLSIFLDHVHCGEHRKSLDRPIALLSRLAERRHAIGGLIENAPGMNEAVIDKILEHNVILRCGHMFVYSDDGILPGAGFSWDVRFLRLYRDYFMPKLQLKGLAYKYGKKLISKDEFQERSARLEKKIQQHLDRKKALEESGKVPAGLKPVSVEASSVVDPKYNKWLSRGDLAVDGSTTSGVWLGGKAKLGTFSGSFGGKPEDGVKDWIKLDFGKPVDIGSIMYETTYPGFEKRIWQEGFTISGSLDGENWAVLVEKQGLKKPQRFTFALSGARVRYVKVHNILSCFEGYPNWRLAYVTEIQVYRQD